jgi:hypothetical protein
LGEIPFVNLNYHTTPSHTTILYFAIKSTIKTPSLLSSSPLPHTPLLVHSFPLPLIIADGGSQCSKLVGKEVNPNSSSTIVEEHDGCCEEKGKRKKKEEGEEGRREGLDKGGR